jgi:Fic family protein
MIIMNLKADIEPAIKTAEDRGEAISLMEPLDIERALHGEYSKDAKKRDLQLEAKAHITVQQWIDDGGLKARAVTADCIREIHRRFCELLPDDLLWVEDPTTKERIKVIPGELRRRDVTVGSHIPVSPAAVPRFLKRFEEVYGRIGKTETILATAAAHHRLAWIHPFLDGNGRVARLMSHATLLGGARHGRRLVNRTRPCPQCQYI